MNEEAKLAAVFPTLTESSLPIEELDLRVGGADEKLDSRRRQLYVYKRARRVRFKGV